MEILKYRYLSFDKIATSFNITVHVYDTIWQYRGAVLELGRRCADYDRQS